MSIKSKLKEIFSLEKDFQTQCEKPKAETHDAAHQKTQPDETTNWEKHRKTIKQNKEILNAMFNLHMLQSLYKKSKYCSIPEIKKRLDDKNVELNPTRTNKIYNMGWDNVKVMSDEQKSTIREYDDDKHLYDVVTGRDYFRNYAFVEYKKDEKIKLEGFRLEGWHHPVEIPDRIIDKLLLHPINEEDKAVVAYYSEPKFQFNIDIAYMLVPQGTKEEGRIKEVYGKCILRTNDSYWGYEDESFKSVITKTFGSGVADLHSGMCYEIIERIHVAPVYIEDRYFLVILDDLQELIKKTEQKIKELQEQK